MRHLLSATPNHRPPSHVLPVMSLCHHFLCVAGIPGRPTSLTPRGPGRDAEGNRVGTGDRGRSLRQALVRWWWEWYEPPRPRFPGRKLASSVGCRKGRLSLPELGVLTGELGELGSWCVQP